MRFSTREIFDLAVAWLALGLAFTLFLEGPGIVEQTTAFADAMLLSMLTVGIGFLLHELAHKVVAVQFGQIAEFRANYTMLGLAVAAALAGFLFAAPGAVHHRGAITQRQHGLVAVAGPVTNLLLAALFLPLLLFVPNSFVAEIGVLGVVINLGLAAFNLLPFGPLDGKTVFRWSKVVHLSLFALSAFLTYRAIVTFF